MCILLPFTPCAIYMKSNFHFDLWLPENKPPFFVLQNLSTLSNVLLQCVLFSLANTLFTWLYLQAMNRVYRNLRMDKIKMGIIRSAYIVANGHFMRKFRKFYSVYEKKWNKPKIKTQYLSTELEHRTNLHLQEFSSDLNINTLRFYVIWYGFMGTNEQATEQLLFFVTIM